MLFEALHVWFRALLDLMSMKLRHLASYLKSRRHLKHAS